MEQICEVGLEFGWFNHPGAEGKCETCWVKEGCETKKLKTDIALMHIHSRIFLKDPNIRPLIGIGEYTRRYEEKNFRLEQLLHLTSKVVVSS